jgi:hypothetical protein
MIVADFRFFSKVLDVQGLDIELVK